MVCFSVLQRSSNNFGSASGYLLVPRCHRFTDVWEIALPALAETAGLLAGGHPRGPLLPAVAGERRLVAEVPPETGGELRQDRRRQDRQGLRRQKLQRGGGAPLLPPLRHPAPGLLGLAEAPRRPHQLAEHPRRPLRR